MFVHIICKYVSFLPIVSVGVHVQVCAVSIRYVVLVYHVFVCTVPTSFLVWYACAGVYRFYQLLTLAYFVASCVVGPQLVESLRQEGPMVPVLKLLTGATALQSVAALTITLHLRT